MRTTVTLDDDLVAKAVDFAGIDEKSKLLNYVLDLYVKRMAAKRLAALGGTMPDLDIPSRGFSSYSEALGMKVAEEKP
jgi:Arc/MetJ family transcription regulator